MNDDERFVIAITALAECFRQKVSPGLFHGYRAGLQGLTAQQIERATAEALKRCKFMPVPSELRELATGSGESYESMAEKAWYVLRMAIQSLGPDASVNFEDGAINAALRLHGGWIRVCEIPAGDDLDKWFRKEFIATYCRLCRDGCSEELRRYHGGVFERDNAKWHGRQMRSGGTYRLGMYGSDVQPIGVGYVPALPAPPPKQLIADRREEFGLELKRIPEH